MEGEERPTLEELSALPENALVQLPLSRRGRGPGLLIFLPQDYTPQKKEKTTKSLDPEPLQKWAEEGFAVVQLTIGQDDDPQETYLNTMDAVRFLLRLPECAEFEKVGVVVYGLNPSFDQSPVADVWRHLWNIRMIAAIIAFTDDDVGACQPNRIRNHPLLVHSTKEFMPSRESEVVYFYETAKVTNFVLPGHENYMPGHAGVAHTRSLGFLKQNLGGPYFDLDAIWEEHTLFEFGERNVEKTMSTMVNEPYVNHVPTMTGGIGRSALTSFYRDHFIFNNPDDTQLELISRTVGVDRVIDEFIFSCTHNKVIDWLVPGIPPTGKQIRVPFTSVVNIRGDRLYHEHISWDQATLLRQLGLLPEYLPFPYALPDGKKPGKGKRFEYRVPTAGAETAEKLVDESSVKSNEMFGFEIREVDDT
ncbi:NTF2-like protein [Mollisia scopiformis]|uniref:NTF2-like protein n=1 Tax=Mollisia scopiformis TaxID=149040 RepID=A0A132B7D4_MOLSC|nr:NTF2-like protein [Mollisia scopiformis]KUJ08153.1 NTF2-like protein [Mollisia scopiformis]